MKRLVMLSMIFVLSGCPRKGDSCTTPGETRCNGTKVQFCDGKKLWVDKTDCVKYKAVCGMKDKRAQCMKGDMNANK